VSKRSVRRTENTRRGGVSERSHSATRTAEPLRDPHHGVPFAVFGRVTDPAGRVTDPAGRVTDPAGRVTDPAGRVTDPAGRLPDSA